MFAFLFDDIRYELNGVEIDRTKNLGYTTTIKNYISLSESESIKLYHAGWSPKTQINSGHLNFCVPLKTLLGFCEDYQKIIVNAKHELILTRSRSDQNAMVVPAANINDAMSFKIFKLHWRVPHINVNERERLSLLNIINQNKFIQIPFRSWDMYEYPILPTTTDHNWIVKTATQLEKPRFVIFALQTNKRNQKAKDPTKFDHCEISNIKLHLNSESFPYIDMNINFENNRYAVLYEMYSKFKKSYYDLNSAPLISWGDFKTIAPIAVIDCSHQNESIKTGSVDVRLEFQTVNEIPADTTAFCLLLHDRIMEYNPLSNIVRKIM